MKSEVQKPRVFPDPFPRALYPAVCQRIALTLDPPIPRSSRNVSEDGGLMMTSQWPEDLPDRKCDRDYDETIAFPFFRNLTRRPVHLAPPEQAFFETLA